MTTLPEVTCEDATVRGQCASWENCNTESYRRHYKVMLTFNSAAADSHNLQVDKLCIVCVNITGWKRGRSFAKFMYTTVVSSRTRRYRCISEQMDNRISVDDENIALSVQTRSDIRMLGGTVALTHLVTYAFSAAEGSVYALNITRQYRFLSL